jgi:hypothetical protein
MLGFKAQEIQETMPGLVEEDEEGFLSVKTSILYLKGLKVIQELIERVEILESKMTNA